MSLSKLAQSGSVELMGEKHCFSVYIPVVVIFAERESGGLNWPVASMI